MITSTTENYTFRTVDLSLFPGLKSAGVATELRLGVPPKLITGHSKAAQNFLRALMTPTGHYRSRPNYGSDLSTKIYAGGMVFIEDLPNTFAVEALRVIDSVFDPKSSSVPDDEVVIRAELADFKVSRSSLEMVINLYFRNEDEPKAIRLPVNIDRIS